MKRLFSFFILVTYSTQSFAQGINADPPSRRFTPTNREKQFSLLTGEAERLGTGEFKAGYFPGAIMIPVHLWGATNVTGLFHIPKNTNLTTLLTYARGPSLEAELDSIRIKRTAENKQKIFKVDVEKLLEDPNHQDIVLMPNDIVYVENKKSIIDPTWVYVIGFLASILGVTAATITLIDRTD